MPNNPTKKTSTKVEDFSSFLKKKPQLTVQTSDTGVTNKISLSYEYLSLEFLEKIATLAHLELTHEEKIKFHFQLNETITHVKALDEIDTKNTEPTSQVTGLENISRNDDTAPSLSQEDALKNSKSTYNRLFKVKGVLKDE